MLEFLYTSAPQTLDGAGYGAVAKSERFPSDLEKFVRKLCRYDFLSNGFDSSESDYPDVYSHSVFRLPTAQWHVFSRIGFAGQDYTQRSVFIAHHVVLSDAELNQTSVTELLCQPDLFRSAWNEPPRLLPPRTIPSRAIAPTGTTKWSAETGDGGWAQVWAQKWMTSRGQPQFLIFPADLNPLPLYLESLDTLAPEEAAQMTFITHLAADHGGPTYEWIGLMANTELATSIERSSKDRVLNLTRPLGSPAAAIANINRTLAARQEQVAREQAAKEAKEQLAKAQAAKLLAAKTAPTAPSATEEDPNSDDYVPDEYRLQQPVVERVRKLTPKRMPRDEDSTPEIPRYQKPQQASMVQTYVTVAAVLVAMCLAIILWSGKKGEPVTKENQQSRVSPAEDETPPQSETKQAGNSNSGSEPLKPNAEKPATPPQGLPPGKEVAIAPPDLGAPTAIPNPKAPRREFVKFFEWGLREALVNAKGQRGKVVNSLEQLKRKDLKSSLIFPPGMNLNVVKTQVSPDGTLNPMGTVTDLKVTCTDVPPLSEVHLQIGEGSVWVVVAANIPELDVNELFNRLRFSMLEIETSESDPEPFVLRIGFTPPVPGIPLSGLKPDPDLSFRAFQKTQDLDLRELFVALNRWKGEGKANLDVVLQIDRITLSILPNQNVGWPQTQLAQSDFKKPLIQQIQIPTGALRRRSEDDSAAVPAVPTIAGTLKVETWFDRGEASTKPAVVAEFQFPLPQFVKQIPDQQPAKVKEDAPETPDPKDKEALKAAKEAKDAEKEAAKAAVKERKEREKAETKARIEAQKNKKPDDQPDPKEEMEKAAVSLLPNLSDQTIFNELFRRYGRIDAKLVIRVPRSPAVSEPGGTLDDILKRKLQGEKVGQDAPLGTQKDNPSADDGLQDIIILQFGE